MGLTEVKAEQLVAEFLKNRIQADFTGTRPIEHKADQPEHVGFPVSFETHSDGYFSLQMIATDDGFRVNGLFAALANMDAFAKASDTSGPTSSRIYIDYARTEGPRLRDEYGMLGIYDYQTSTMRTWDEFIAWREDAIRRMEAAEKVLKEESTAPLIR